MSLNKLKASFFLFALASSFQVSAISCPQYEAQIIASVDVLNDGIDCVAKIRNVRHYSFNQLCPLLFEDVLYKEVKLTSLQCERASLNGEISGVLFQDGSSEELQLDDL